MTTLDYARPNVRVLSVLTRQAQRRLFLLVIIGGDILALGAAFALAYWLRFYLGLGFSEKADPAFAFYRTLVAMLIPLWIALFYFFKLYNWNYLFGGLQEYARVVNVTTLATMALVGATFFLQTFWVSRGWIVFSWVLTMLLLLAARFGVRRFGYLLRRKGYLRTATLIVGADAEGRAIANQLKETPTCGADVIGYLDDPRAAGEKVDGLQVLGPVSAIQGIVAQAGVEEVLLSTAALTRTQVIHIYQTFAESDTVRVRFSPGLFEILTTGAWVKEWGTVPLVTINKVRLSDFEAWVKSVLDRVAALGALILLAPLLLILAILVKSDSLGPALHRRRVLGRGGREFDALKFRTMRVDGDAIMTDRPDLQEELRTNHKLKIDPRVTRVGRFLRRYSLDELPQLFNVLWGQMSLVGPRIITPAEKGKYGKMGMNLLTVKPGITGLWQISGRSDVSYEERVRLDMQYIRNYSIWLDLMIILRTLPAVLQGRGAY